jgi:hypothetical protein
LKGALSYAPGVRTRGGRGNRAHDERDGVLVMLQPEYDVGGDQEPCFWV